MNDGRSRPIPGRAACHHLAKYGKRVHEPQWRRAESEDSHGRSPSCITTLSHRRRPLCHNHRRPFTRFALRVRTGAAAGEAVFLNGITLISDLIAR